MAPRALVGLVLALAACDRTADDAKAGPAAGPVPAAKDAPAWPTHTSEPCGFTLALPFPRTPAAVAPGLLDLIAAEDAIEQVAVIASCGDVPRVSSEEEFLDVTSSAMAQQMGATEPSKRAIDLQGRRGLELVMRVPADRKPPGVLYAGDLGFRVRLYVSGLRQYQLQVLHSSTVDVDALAQAFFDSFALTDSAPPPATPAEWTRHTVGDHTVEAPGKPVPLEGDASMRKGFAFETDHGSTGYAASLWDAALPGGDADARQRLRLHFMLRVASKDADVVSETFSEPDGRPTLDISYRFNTPMPAHIASDDPEVREVANAMIAERDQTLHLRLVLVQDAIVQLLARAGTPEDERKRFFDSLHVE